MKHFLEVTYPNIKSRVKKNLPAELLEEDPNGGYFRVNSPDKKYFILVYADALYFSFTKP